jgi:hypothetical protein
MIHARHHPSAARTKALSVNLFLAVALLTVVIGCKRSAEPPSAGAGTSPTGSTITGAFGFRLGEKLSDDIPTTPNEVGGGIGVVFKTTNFPPFDTVVVGALDDRRICSIMADYHGDHWDREKQLILSVWQKKYGAPKPLGGGDAVFWGDERRAIILGNGTLTYSDRALLEIAARSRKDARVK